MTEALEKLGAAVHAALAEAPVADVLGVITGVFVGLTVEVVRRQGHDVSMEIKVDGRTMSGAAWTRLRPCPEGSLTRT